MDALRAIAQNNYSIESFYLKVVYDGSEKNSFLNIVKALQDLHYNVKQIDVEENQVVGILFKMETVTNHLKMVFK